MILKTNLKIVTMKSTYPILKKENTSHTENNFPELHLCINEGFCKCINDTLDRNVLLKKMECVGFKKPAIKWFKFFLSNRKFFVSIEAVFSEKGLLTCGVPQSSILGPLLF